MSEITSANGNYVLAADIDASSFGGFSFTDFTGTLDGGYHTISGLTVPLFNNLNGATVKNLRLDNVSINRTGADADAGAVCIAATGNTKVYNCGVLATTASTVQGTRNVGGLVGRISTGSNVRVVNCYNYATVVGGTYAAGIVGRNRGTVGATRIAMCMMYGDISGGTNRSPVYAGNHISNNQSYNEYNYYRSRASLTYTAYNDQLAIDKDEFLTRFPFYRHILNTHREMAAYFLFGDHTDAHVAEIGHWVLKPEVAPYPIIEPWEKNTRRTTVDIAAHLPSTAERYAGRLLDDITADNVYRGDGTQVTTMGTNGYLRVNVSINGSSYTADLPITDMDTLRHDFTWGKVVLPFANEFDGWTRDYSKICTGWKITAVTGGTTGTLTNYDFADRDCTAKDIYNATTNPYIFAQGGNFIVPYGVTAITIEANFANAFYLSDAYADCGYNAAYSAKTDLGWQVPTTYHGRPVYTDLGTLLGAMATHTDPHHQAIVLVGNFHYNQRMIGTKFTNRTTGLTIMSVDEDNNQEPDYGWYSFHTTDRTEIPPLRFDFVPNIGIGMATRVTNSNPNPSIGIWRSHGWFELTETCVSFMSECEISQNDQNATDNGYGNNRWIANSGFFKQIVYTRNQNATKMSYVQIGGNAYVEQFYPGPHANQNNSIKLVPVNVTGGEIEECFMTGKGQNSSAQATGSNIYLWCAGGRIHKYLSAYMVNPSTAGVNVTVRADHALIRRFFGGGTSAAAQITGNIDITMNNSKVDFFCGGPEFGDMAAGKTVTTRATGSTFGVFYGAGFGGTAITWQTKTDGTKTFNADLTYTESFANYTNDRLKYVTNYGFGTCYDFDFIMYSGGGDGNNANGKGVARFYTGYAQFSLATTGSVTNTLNHCTILTNFYGGGCQGKVSGNATSTLTDCLVKGNAYAAGFKASANTLEVYPTTQPTYSVYTKETGIFSDFGTVAPETWTWVPGAVGAKNESAKELSTGMTAAEMATLGTVTGSTYLTLDGDCHIGTDGDAATGSVFGGGQESAVSTDTHVVVKGNTIVNGEVFGGGNMGPVGGNTNVKVCDDCSY